LAAKAFPFSRSLARLAYRVSDVFLSDVQYAEFNHAVVAFEALKRAAFEYGILIDSQQATMEACAPHPRLR